MRRGLIVLAGGRSKRMGQDKAWLRIGEQTALERVVQAGLDAQVDAVVVVGAPTRPLPPLPEGVVRVDDPADRAYEGPLSGLSVGLTQLVSEDVQITSVAACDALWLGAPHIRYVLEALVGEEEHDAVVPETLPDVGPRVLHPLCGAVRVEPALQLAQSLLRSGQRAARALLIGLHARRLEVSDLPEPRAVHGCNTPEQWSEAAAALASK